MPDEYRISPPAPVCTPDAHGHCSVCADEGRPGRVLAVDAAAQTAQVRLDGTEQTVALDLTDGVRAGDVVLVHLGFVIAVVEES